MCKSFREYSKAVFGWWWIIVICTILVGVQFLISIFIADKIFEIPVWTWIGCILLGFLVANFFAFHKYG